MGKVVVSANVSLDGVVHDPAGDEGFARGGWVGLIKDRPELGKLALEEAVGAEALLLGRRSYQWFAARWPTRRGELADRLNTMPKYVVSSTLKDADWPNSTVLKGDVVSEVSRLRQQLAGEIVVAASFRLVHTLIEHDLVDELRLKIFPVSSAPASASSPKPVTRSPCALSPTESSMTASPTSPSRSTEKHRGRPTLSAALSPISSSQRSASTRPSCVWRCPAGPSAPAECPPRRIVRDCAPHRLERP
jgi:dihydrofolate reductase